MEETLLSLINDCNGFLDEESAKEIMHYFNHGEYEMSLEGLMLEMTYNCYYPRNYSISDVIDLCHYYKLDKENVFDDKIWIKIKMWENAYKLTEE